MKATIEIERDLWKRVRRAALDEDRQAWRIVTEALEAYLAKKKGGAK
jgi:predicted transcriptional regulator